MQSRALAAEHGKRMADAMVNRPPEEAGSRVSGLGCRVLPCRGAFALERHRLVAKITARAADELAQDKTIVLPTLERPRDIKRKR